jgi:hypothetical protein
MSVANVYRPRRDRGLLCLGAGLVFAAAGSLMLAMGGVHALFVLCCVLGGLATVVALLLLTTRVVVDDAGVAKRPLLANGFVLRWEDVESWSVAASDLDDSFTFRVVRFKVRGKRRECRVHDSEAWRPAFEQFLGDVRAHARDREVQAPARHD